MILALPEGFFLLTGFVRRSLEPKSDPTRHHLIVLGPSVALHPRRPAQTLPEIKLFGKMFFGAGWQTDSWLEAFNAGKGKTIHKDNFFTMTDAKEVKFIFVCPDKNEVFESSDFKILDNKGIITDESGNKTLDAKVALNQPCPVCGQKHVYHASELLCPFTG